MRVSTDKFRDRSTKTIQNIDIQKSLENVYNNFHKRRIHAAQDTENWELLREKGKNIKDHTISNLDHYLDELSANVEKNGGKIFFAKDAGEANEYIQSLVRSRHVKTVIKSKSMVSEEIGINDVLKKMDVESIETDLGEYIVQLAGEPPYHLIAPAIHKTREEISRLIAPKQSVVETDPKKLTKMARQQLRSVFRRSDMSITGVNFAVAESGSIVLVTNEGNGRMATSLPKIHVALMGMEKVIPTIPDLSTMLRILIRSATGQRISSYVTMINGPKGTNEDGPEEFHLVILDNGRSKLLGDDVLREALNCIRCGACLNACPIYRKAGGHSYGWVYPGPIGAVISPVMTGIGQGKDLPFASTLCGACHEACPVKINIPRMLLELRNQIKEGSNPVNGGKYRFLEPLIWGLWKWIMSSRRKYEMVGRFSTALARPLANNGWLKKMPPPFSGWTSSRDFPLPKKVSFMEQQNKKHRKSDGE